MWVRFPPGTNVKCLDATPILNSEGSEDVIIVYGTSTTFQPEFEGRIASEIETAELPESWRKFLSLERRCLIAESGGRSPAPPQAL